jgi:MGT family glycosyltransferase
VTESSSIASTASQHPELPAVVAWLPPPARGKVSRFARSVQERRRSERDGAAAGRDVSAARGSDRDGGRTAVFVATPPRPRSPAPAVRHEEPCSTARRRVTTAGGHGMRPAMARILAIGDGGFLSHVSRPLEIAKQLRTAGHEVVFAATGPYAELATNAGFDVRPIRTVPVARILSRSRIGRADWYTLEHIRETVAADEALFDAVAPELVLGDFRHSLHTSCELAGVPFASILNASWTNYYSVVYRAPEHLAVTRLLGERLATRISPWVKSAILRWDVRAHNHYRRERGLGPFWNVWEMFSGDLNLLVDIPEYGPTADLPANYRYVGPVIWEPEVAVPSWLERIDPGRPTLYFTMGSTGHARYLEEALRIFGGTDYQCLMTTAGLIAPSAVPENFFVCEFAPGSALMEKCDVVVCQGGNGTIYQALRAGVPVIGIPTMHDQEFNLQRVVDLGVGVQLSDLRFRAQDLRDAVAGVLEDPQVRSNAARLARTLAEHDGPRAAAEEIGAFLAGAPRPWAPAEQRPVQ